MKTAREILAALKSLESFAEDGCGAGVFSEDDVNAVIEWAEKDDGGTLSAAVENWSHGTVHFGRLRMSDAELFELEQRYQAELTRSPEPAGGKAGADAGGEQWGSD